MYAACREFIYRSTSCPASQPKWLNFCTARQKQLKLPTNLKLKEVPISSIKVWEEAEASELRKEGLRELAASIEAEGLQSPPLVQKDGEEYRLISGQRRLEALKTLGV